MKPTHLFEMVAVLLVERRGYVPSESVDRLGGCIPNGLPRTAAADPLLASARTSQ